MNIIFCLIAAISITISQGGPLTINDHQLKEKPCATPQQWEAGFGVVTASMQKEEGVLDQVFGNVSVDAKGMMIAASEYFARNDKQPIPVRVIQNYKKNMQYLIVGDKCTKTPLEGGMAAFIPDNATYLGQLSLGFGSNKATVTSWSIQYAGYKQITQKAVTVGDCVPVSSLSFGDQVEIAQGAPGLSSMGFFNVTMGIKSEDVFTPPDICNHVHEKEMKKHFTRGIHEIVRMHHK